MPKLDQIGIVDLAVLLVVAGAVIGALRRRSGLLAAVAGGAAAALVCWLAAAAVLTWGSPPVSSLVDRSYLLDLVPPPVRAMHQLGELVTPLITHISSVIPKGPQS